MDTHMYNWKEIVPLNESRSCIIEFQAFRGNDNKFIVKELVILDVKSGLTNYFLFKPPHPFYYLDEKPLRTNKWLSKYFHHISWNEGYTSYKELPRILKQYCRKYKQIFTTGLEKCDFISLYTPSNVTIYNICRQKERIIPRICMGVRCKNHITNCAMSNAFGLRETLQKESEHFEVSGGDKLVGVLGHK
jgi:hypothetical protein